MIETETTIIRFLPSDVPTGFPELADAEPPDEQADNEPPLQTQEPREWRPLGAEW